MYDKAGLLKFAKSHFQLDWYGYHGAGHWSRVYHNGRFICKHTPMADQLVVELFAWCHDLARVNENTDFVHGFAAAELIQDQLHGRFFDLNDRQLDALIVAVSHHSDGHTLADPTIQACWDSDRLDLGRVGILPLAQHLCTPIAQEPLTIETAWKNSRKWSRAKPIR